MKKLIAFSLAVSMLLMAACTADNSITESTAANTTATEETGAMDATEAEPYAYLEYASMSAAEIVSQLTLEQKTAQMVQAAVYSVTTQAEKTYCYGSILSCPGRLHDDAGWAELVDSYQTAALQSEAGIPFIYGNDDVHGVNYCENAVIFPHNIGIGAANDAELTYQMGLAVADEAKLTHMLWNFSPCVAQSVDPRWGRTYESYGADLDLITSLSSAYTKGMLDGGVVACAKHFFGDGNVYYGTGEDSEGVDRLIDRGDATLTDEEIEALLAVYQTLIDDGVQTIMISHSSLNGTKMHENAAYIQMLKEEMGFTGFIVSDWNSVQNTSGETYAAQVITAVNAGIDMLMEVDDFETARQILVQAVADGEITEARIDDAVTRILQVKLDAGLFEDPLCETLDTTQESVGSEEYRTLARTLVSESLVLLKNEGDVLPLQSGTTIYVTGPAANDTGAQCGGWTVEWNGNTDAENFKIPWVTGATTILDGLNEVGADYDITFTTEPENAAQADAVLLVVGETAYAEWNGDTEDLALCGELGLEGNLEAIEAAKELNKPTVACIVAGRQVLIEEYMSDWDAVVMCYLPGSEGAGVADVLLGASDFRGKLPSPWYADVTQIGTDECWLEQGYGLTYTKE